MPCIWGHFNMGSPLCSHDGEEAIRAKVSIYFITLFVCFKLT